MTYNIVVDISKKNNKHYAYIDLGYTRKFIDLNLVAELIRKPVSELYEIKENGVVAILNVNSYLTV